MKSLDAALTLLSQFMSSDPDFGVGELSERTGMPKSQVFEDPVDFPQARLP